MSVYSRALHLAYELHEDQRRKQSDIPYISHLLGVSALVLEDGGSEIEGAGALLHDAAEDQGGDKAIDKIVSICGPDVAGLVIECSEPYGEDRPPWRERKDAYIGKLPKASDDAIRIMIADKLHNVRSILFEFGKIGAEVWGKFRASPAETVWFYEACLREFEKRRPRDDALVGLLFNEVAHLGVLSPTPGAIELPR